MSPTPSAGLSIGYLDSQLRPCIIQLFTRFNYFMSTKLMVELLKRGKTGNDMLVILDAITGPESKLSAVANAIVLDKPQVPIYALSEPPMF